MIASAAICAEPAKTIADISTAAQAGIPTSRASTPNDVASSPPATANGSPARTPALNARAHAAARLRFRSAASSAHGRVFATCAGVSHARRAVAMP